MATTIEELRAVMRMEPSALALDLQKPDGHAARAAGKVATTWHKAVRKLDEIGDNPTPGSWRLSALFGRR